MRVTIKRIYERAIDLLGVRYHSVPKEGKIRMCHKDDIECFSRTCAFNIYGLDKVRNGMVVTRSILARYLHRSKDWSYRLLRRLTTKRYLIPENDRSRSTAYALC